MKEFAAHKDEIKKTHIASYMEELKQEGKILPIPYKEVEALLTTATEEKFILILLKKKKLIYLSLNPFKKHTRQYAKSC
ncbi:MAG: hypothetical protein CM15mV101_430 [uncultured marine virus]|nr:MAG: hypothetical protein CM15mV101_430 [uncultured marine virus]